MASRGVQSRPENPLDGQLSVPWKDILHSTWGRSRVLESIDRYPAGTPYSGLGPDASVQTDSGLLRGALGTPLTIDAIKSESSTWSSDVPPTRELTSRVRYQSVIRRTIREPAEAKTKKETFNKVSKTGKR